MKIYFWQPSLNPHEAAYIKVLASRGYQCVVIAGAPPIERLQQGVGVGDYGQAEVRIVDGTFDLNNIDLCFGDGDVHVFTGVRAFQITRSGYDMVKKTRSKIVLFSEARNFLGFYGFLRWIDSFVFEFLLRRRIDRVLAIGDLGVSWFKSIGYNKNKIIRFFYSVEWSFYFFEEPKDEVIRIVFAGQLIDRKNPEIIFNALSKANLDSKSISLSFYGEGPCVDELRKMSLIMPDNINVCFLGSVGNEELRKDLKNTDILVLPSKWDGWGAVVTEALHAGSFVIVSDKCGSSCVVENKVGAVFPSGSVESLTAVFNAIIPKLPLSKKDREFISNYSNAVSAHSAADIFEEKIINF